MTANARASGPATYGTRRRPAARRRPGARRGASRVNWDKVGRVALTLVLAAVLYSYLNPLIDMVKTYTATSAAKAQFHRVLEENKRLHRRVQDSGNRVVLEAKARGQGMIGPGETPLVIRRSGH